MTQAGVEALIVSDQSENYTNRRLIVELAEAARLPAIYPFLAFTDVGGLMAYSVPPDVFGHLADQVDQILKGAKPGDIPFYQAREFHLSINMKTAKALGLTVPMTLFARADEVIE